MNSKNYQQPKGQILLFGPSFSGKTFLTNAFKKMNLIAYDLEKEGKYVNWVNDKTGKVVTNLPNNKPAKWFSENHFLLDRQQVTKFLKNKPECIVFTHSWDILYNLDLFDKTFYMYVPPQELEKRMNKHRPDHKRASKAQLEFMQERHRTRLHDAKELNIPILDVSQAPEKILNYILNCIDS